MTALLGDPAQAVQPPGSTSHRTRRAGLARPARHPAQAAAQPARRQPRARRCRAGRAHLRRPRPRRNLAILVAMGAAHRSKGHAMTGQTSRPPPCPAGAIRNSSAASSRPWPPSHPTAISRTSTAPRTSSPDQPGRPRRRSPNRQEVQGHSRAHRRPHHQPRQGRLSPVPRVPTPVPACGKCVRRNAIPALDPGPPRGPWRQGRTVPRRSR
jgi:hypothetical protein